MVRHLFAELNFNFQLALPQEFIELFLELNSTDTCQLNELKVNEISQSFTVDIIFDSIDSSIK